MNEFKFGDLVRHEIHSLGLVVQDESETQGYLVYVKFKATGDTHAFSSHWKPDFNYHPSSLTLISRHQEWTKLDAKDKSTWPEKNKWHMTYMPTEPSRCFDDVGMFFLSDDTGGDDEDLIWIGADDDIEFSSVTHWMLLPGPPMNSD